MTCKTCIEGNICKVKEYTMKCDKCDNKQFYTRRKNHIPVEYVCSLCGEALPIKNKKPKEEEKEIKEAE